MSCKTYEVAWKVAVGDSESDTLTCSSLTETDHQNHDFQKKFSSHEETDNRVTFKDQDKYILDSTDLKSSLEVLQIGESSHPHGCALRTHCACDLQEFEEGQVTETCRSDSTQKCSSEFLYCQDRTLNAEDYNKAMEKWQYSSLAGSISEQNDEVYRPFDSLPTELLLKIFAFLTPHELCQHVSGVCKKWYDLAYDPSLWRYLNLTNSQINVVDLSRILQRSPGLQKLSLHGCLTLTEVEVSTFAPHCQNLLDLDLGFCGVEVTMTGIIIQNCPHLRSLNVEGCPHFNHDCVKLLPGAPDLQIFNFSHCKLEDESVVLLAESFQEIVSLNIDGISWITDEPILELIKCHQSHLKNLEVDGMELTDESVKAMTGCTNLRALSISFCELLTDLSLSYIKNMKNLKMLRLKKATEFTNEGLCNLFEGRNMQHLQHLDLSECVQLLDSGVHALVTCCGDNLNFLALNWCWRITDVGLIAIVDHGRQMRCLDLIGIDKITGECLDRVPEEMKPLRFLDLQQCNRINDNLIVDVVRRKPDLRVLNYYGEEFVYGDEVSDPVNPNQIKQQLTLTTDQKIK